MKSDDHFWQNMAACRELPAQAAGADFYPADRRSAGARLAKQFCGACPIRLMCLDWAMDNEEQFGIWGGLDPVEREWLRNPTTIMEDADAES